MKRRLSILPKTLLNWRKDKEVIHTGKLKHYIPDDGLYVYFRYNDKESVMVILNSNDLKSRTITRRSTLNRSMASPKDMKSSPGRQLRTLNRLK